MWSSSSPYWQLTQSEMFLPGEIPYTESMKGRGQNFSPSWSSTARQVTPWINTDTAWCGVDGKVSFLSHPPARSLALNPQHSAAGWKDSQLGPGAANCSDGHEVKRTGFPDVPLSTPLLLLHPSGASCQHHTPLVMAADQSQHRCRWVTTLSRHQMCACERGSWLVMGKRTGISP